MKTMQGVCKALGQQTIPADDPVFAYADRVGLSRELLALQWGVFKARRGATGKRQRGLAGWRQAFRNSVESNWFRLWFIGADGAAALTTVGRQALADADALARDKAEPDAANDDGQRDGCDAQGVRHG